MALAYSLFALVALSLERVRIVVFMKGAEMEEKWISGCSDDRKQSLRQRNKD
jgi:hypothetical protein